MKPKQPEEILSTLRSAIEGLESPGHRSKLLKGLMPPVRERRTFSTTGGDAQGDLWLFFVIPSRKEVALAYSDEGYGLLGRRWGLVFAHSDLYGDFDAWYNSLEHLLIDNSPYFGLE
jgi:hypothetical protein